MSGATTAGFGFQRKSWHNLPMPKTYMSNILASNVVDIHFKPAEKKIEREKPIKETPLVDQPQKIVIEPAKIAQEAIGNLKKSMEICEGFFVQLNKNFDCKKIFLRLEARNRYDAIFVIKKSDFFSDKFVKTYSEAIKFIEEKKSSNFDLSFTFIPGTKTINRKTLSGAGYFFSYEK
ncbi:MAG: hypothetical protein HY064_14665 [Bacteroidetes bacterium]|nr:hypothetical protein [Bacteroidota bacterium]